MYDASRINTVTVIGFGTMGLGIVQNFAEAGVAVRTLGDAVDDGRRQPGPPGRGRGEEGGLGVRRCFCRLCCRCLDCLVLC